MSWTFIFIFFFTFPASRSDEGNDWLVGFVLRNQPVCTEHFFFLLLNHIFNDYRSVGQCGC